MSWERARGHNGTAIAVLGTAVVTYFTLYSALGIRAEGLPPFLAITGLISLSLLISLLINYGSFWSLREAHEERRRIETLYETLDSRIRPLLLTGMEDTLRRRVKELPWIKNGIPLKFFVFTEIDGLYKVVGSTVEHDAQVRRLELEPDEGVVGFTVDRKISGLAQITEGKGNVFDRAGRVIGQQRRLREVNTWKVDADLKWIYTIPIFEKLPGTPWSNRIVGVLTVDSSDDQGDHIFRDRHFQDAIDMVSSDVSPYLDVLQSVLRREKT